MSLRRIQFKWWKRNDAAAVMAAIVAGPLVAGIWLSGCGGGGGGGLSTSPPPPPAPGLMVRGTVYAPNRQVRSGSTATTTRTTTKQVATRQVTSNYNQVTAGVRVVIGTVNNVGEGFSALNETTTDSLGGYTITLPHGQAFGPNILVRAINGTVILHNIVTGPVVDISPETTAAVNLLFSAARARGIAISRLRLDPVNNYISTAVEIARF